jgi:hypothetical protein
MHRQVVFNPMADTEEVITLTSCKIEPNECPLGSEMSIKMTFR